MLVRILTLVAAVGVVTLAGPAAADAPGSTRASARAHAEVAQKFFRLGKFDRAAEEYKAAYEAVPSPPLLYNLGQTYRQLGDYKQALFFYRQFLASEPEAPARARAELRVEQLQRLLDAQPARPAESEPAPTPSAPAPTPPPVVTAPPPSPAPTASPRERPLYRRPWLWGVVAGGAVLIAVGVGLGVVYGSRTVDPAPSLGVASARGF